MSGAVVKNNSRKPWIDVLRAMAMLFVLFGHQAQWFNEFFLFTTPIKIPLFFTISGYLFNDRGGAQKEFYINWFLKLVVPFFCLVTIPATFLSFYYGVGFLLESWRKMFSGESFWFMTCLIVAEVIHFYIRKFFERTFWVTIACMACAATGLLLAHFMLMDYAQVNTALISQFFLLLGFLMRKYEDALDRLKAWVPITIFVLYIILCYLSQYLFANIDFDCHLNQYYNVSYCSLLIITGCVSCFLISKKIRRFPSFLIYIGQNTLLLYLWFGYTLIFFTILSKVGVTLPKENIFTSLIQTIWGTCVCMLVAPIVNKYVPIIVGKRKIGTS